MVRRVHHAVAEAQSRVICVCSVADAHALAREAVGIAPGVGVALVLASLELVLKGSPGRSVEFRKIKGSVRPFVIRVDVARAACFRVVVTGRRPGRRWWRRYKYRRRGSWSGRWWHLWWRRRWSLLALLLLALPLANLNLVGNKERKQYA